MSDSGWMYTFLPIYAVSSGIGVILPIYILFLGGNVFQVGVAIALFNLVAIPSSVLWGELTDKLEKTKLFILVSVAGVIPILLIMYMLAYVPVVQVMYGFYAFIGTAASPAINILLMRNRRRGSMPKYFSRYSVLAIIGGLAGMIPGAFMADGYIRDYLLVLLGVNLLALVLAILLVSEDIKKEEKGAVKKDVRRSFAVLNMLSKTTYILTGSSLINRIHYGLKDKKIKDIYLLLAATVFFNLGLYMFNSSYIPFLNKNSVGYGGIFTINIANSLGQLLIYGAVLSLIRKIDLGRYYKVSTLIRGASYAVAFVPFLFTTTYFFTVNAIAYTAAGAAYALWNVTSSVLFYTLIKNMKKGHYIGIWIAMLGAAAVAGAFLSGLISSLFGYTSTFSLSIVAILASFLIFIYAEKYHDGLKRKTNAL